MEEKRKNLDIVQFDHIKGALHSLEHIERKTTIKFKYFIETAPDIGRPGNWITAVFKNGEYIPLEESQGSHQAKRVHYEWYRKIKHNGYKLDRTLHGYKEYLQKEELPERMYSPRVSAWKMA